MKIYIFGASGTGVTTLGRELAAALSIDYFDSDSYFWLATPEPFTIKEDPEKRNDRIVADLCKLNNWILGGSITDWGKNLFQEFDLAVFLYLPHNLRMERIKEREYKTFGNNIDNDPVRRERYQNYLSWAADYDFNTGIANRTFHSHNLWMNENKIPVLKLVGDMTINQRKTKVLERLSEDNIMIK